MKRYCCMLLLAACVLGEGCRRGGSGTPRDPVKVKQEKDILMVQKEDTSLFAARPAELRYKLYNPTIKSLEQKAGGKAPSKDDLQKAVANQEEVEKDTKASEMVSKLKEAATQEDTLDEFQEFAQAAIEFFKKTSPNKYSEDDFYTFARRSEKYAPRKFLDKTKFEVAVDKYYLYRFLDNKKANISPYVDMNAPDYIIAYANDGDNQGQYVTMSNEKLGKMKGEQVKAQLHMQEMKILGLHFLNFARKNPPEPRELASFKKYLKENSPPPLLKSIEDKTLVVNLTANLRNGNDPIGSRGDFEVSGSGDKAMPLGHQTVYVGGGVQYVFPQNLPYPLTPAKKQ
jgi:hypothetical protein